MGRYCCYLQFTGWENHRVGLGNSPQSTPIGKGTLKYQISPDTWVFSFCLKRPADGWHEWACILLTASAGRVVWLLILLTTAGCSPHCSIISHLFPVLFLLHTYEQPWVMLSIKFIWLIWQHFKLWKMVNLIERNEVQMPGEGEEGGQMKGVGGSAHGGMLSCLYMHIIETLPLF